MLRAPTASFQAQLELLRLVPTFEAVGPGDGVSLAAHTRQAELSDLEFALQQTGTAADAAASIVANHRAARQKLLDYLTEVERWDNSRPWLYDPDGGRLGDPKLPPPQFPSLQTTPGLPPEFQDYFEGALAWHNPLLVDKSAARQAWERLLARPRGERHFKSTWAAFMLGKSWMEENDFEKARLSFQQVRWLVRQGCADSIGLAAASFGLEARLHLGRKEFERAIDLYLQQLATGDRTAAESLRMTAESALKTGGETLQALARHHQARLVLTAYFVSRGPSLDYTADEDHSSGSPGSSPAVAWLEALETEQVRDLDLAERLALTAYQNNEMEMAQRWVERSAETPVVQWLQAKLLLRAGKLAEAAAQLARAVQHFPVVPPGTNGPVDFKDLLTAGEQTHGPHQWGRGVRGELGVLQLARGEYAQALDCLLTSGYWRDAAYVAERVLSLDELKAYVDTKWPSPSAEQEAAEAERFAGAPPEVTPTVHRKQIRHLLARRLTRSFRGDEARAYYPPDLRPAFDQLTAALRAGWEESRAASNRARALFEAALITRTNGMELLGTELEPDGAIYGGAFETASLWQLRSTNALVEGGVAPATRDELARASASRPDPDARYHYRYQAAFLGWEAAKLMPNNSEETARVLCVAGSWLKNRDPDTADLFYKALVRRNRQTEIGKAADRLRWFPVLDEDGNLPRTATEADTPSEPLMPMAGGGYKYSVHWGDTLVRICRHCAGVGVPVTVEELLQANPGLDPARLRIGQTILVPGPARPVEEDRVLEGLPEH